MSDHITTNSEAVKCPWSVEQMADDPVTTDEMAEYFLKLAQCDDDPAQCDDDPPNSVTSGLDSLADLYKSERREQSIAQTMALSGVRYPAPDKLKPITAGIEWYDAADLQRTKSAKKRKEIDRKNAEADVIKFRAKDAEQAKVRLTRNAAADAYATSVEVKSSPMVPVDLWAKWEPPALPIGLLPSVIEQYAFEQGELMGADPSGIAMGALTVCAAAIPDRLQLQVKKHNRNWKESTRLWVALVSEASGIKSPIMREVVRRFRQIEADLWKKHLTAKHEYDQLEKEEQKRRDKPKAERIKIEDTTPESVQEVLKDNPEGVLLFRDELSAWFGGMDKYASGGRGAAADRGFWLTAYNGGSYSFDRVSRGSAFIENLSVSILGGIQPGVARKILTEGIDDGLIQRINPIMLKPGIGGKDEPLSESADRYDDLVDRLYKLRNNFHYPDVIFDDDARAIRSQLEQKHRDQMISKTLNTKLRSHLANTMACSLGCVCSGT